jgi:two-component system NtrC family sensor kinase
MTAMPTSQTLIQSIIDHAFDAIVTIDGEGRVTGWNPMAEQLFGWPFAEAAGRPLSDLIIPERFRAAHTNGMANFLASGRGSIINRRIETSAQHRDGREFPVELSVTHVESGDSHAFTAFIHDISARKAAERRLQRDVDTQNALSSILRVALEPVLLERQLERTLDVLLALPWLSLKAQGCIFLADGPEGQLVLAAQRNLAPQLQVSCATVPFGHCLCGRAAATRSVVFASCLDERHETRFPGIRPHGHYCIPIDSGKQLLGVLNVYVDEGRERDPEQEAFLAAVADSLAGIIERKRAEERLEASNQALKQTNHRLEQAQSQLLQAEKMASIGQLAAGVAHEINNPIGYIHCNLGTLQEYVTGLSRLIDAYEASVPLLASVAPEQAERLAAEKRAVDFDYLRRDIADLVRESQEGVSRVRQIVVDLKEFSHVGDDEWRSCDLHKGLESTLNVVWNEIKYKAEVVRAFGDLPPVECLPQQINQVFMNLLVNAAQAIEEKGTITLRSGADAGWCWVEVTDTGRGIPPEQLNRIFDPFFTTKPVGKGTGLGLSIAYGIIGKHHGRIEVESREGAGSTFRIHLPVTQSAAGHAAVQTGATEQE